MISFIVIGRNEGWKLPKCIDSIFTLIRFNKIINFEIVYIDSNSSDASLEGLKHYGSSLKTYKIFGDINAAVARNVGADNSSGDILFFVDGDMELEKNFLPLVYKENKLIRNYISGNWMNYFYDQDGKFLFKKKYLELESDTIETTTGGLFIIERKVWEMIGGMNVKFTISEDIDLGLRLAQKKIFLLRKKEILAKHHTISYLDEKRMWQDFFKWNHLYGRSLIYRRHVFNKYMYPRMIRNDYSMIFLLICFAGIFLFNKISLLLISLYLILVMLRSKFSLSLIFYYFLRDLSVLIGLFAFHPRKNNYSIDRVQ